MFSLHAGVVFQRDDVGYIDAETPSPMSSYPDINVDAIHGGENSIFKELTPGRRDINTLYTGRCKTV